MADNVWRRNSLPKYFVTRRTMKSRRLKIFICRNLIKIPRLRVYYRPGCTQQRRNGLVVPSLELHHISTLVFRLFFLGIIYTHAERIRDVVITYYVFILPQIINHLADEYPAENNFNWIFHICFKTKYKYTQKDGDFILLKHMYGMASVCESSYYTCTSYIAFCCTIWFSNRKRIFTNLRHS